MIWSNKYNLPQPLVSAVQRDSYRKAGHISVTGLIKAPRMRILEDRHDSEITVDVSDRLWALLGQSIATILERADTFDHLVEEQLTTELHGWTISGRPDLLKPNMILQDYKVTSVYSFLLGDKPEWEAQLNLYAWLYRKHGFEVKAAQIVAILRDWVSSRALHEPDYPQAGFIVKDIPLWAPEEQEAFAGQRVRMHQTTEKLSDDDLPQCAPEERWQRPDKWAVKKPTNKKAYRVFEAEAEAIDLMQKMPGMEAVFRAGESVRCARFCSAAPFCSQWERIKPKEPIEEADA